MWPAGALLAFLAQMIFPRHLMHGFVYVDFLLLFVVFHATSRYEDRGMVAGAVAGLMEDAFSGGPPGLFALSKTILGYGVGKTSRWLMLHRPLFYPAVAGVSSLLHDLLVVLLLQISHSAGPYLPVTHILARMICNAVVGLLFLIAGERLPFLGQPSVAR
jgi:rod shape-determining protein MreD